MPASRYSEKITMNSRRLWGKKRPRLGHLDIELTERCDNDCIHCCINLPENDFRAKDRELRASEWRRVLQDAAELGALSVRFTGGEPLLRDDFAGLYVFARKLGMKVILFTNARKITPELADLMARITPLEKIEVSVYGLRRESYEAVSRIPGSYDEHRRGLDLLLRNKIPFTVKGALLPANKNEIDEFESWARALMGMAPPPSFSLNFELRGRRDSAARNTLIKKLRATPEETVAILNRHREAYRREMREFCMKFIGPPGVELFHCGAGLGGCVDAYGQFQPCLALRAPELGINLREVSLRDALTRDFPRLIKMAASNPAYLRRCAVCFLKGLCTQCPARSWAEHGSLDSPVEYFCAVAHAQAVDLGLLSEGEHGWEVKDWRDRISRLPER